MSSPKLNNIIILGCILCYASVVLFGLDARFLDMKGYGANCNVRERFFVGYNLQRIVIYTQVDTSFLNGTFSVDAWKAAALNHILKILYICRVNVCSRTSVLQTP